MRRIGRRTFADRPGKQYLHNGDFAGEPFPGAVFDWRVTPLDHVSVARDCESHSEECSLRIQFDGSANVSFDNVSQIVLVEPGRFVFRASVRTANVTTDQGLAFEIKDGENEGRMSVVSTATERNDRIGKISRFLLRLGLRQISLKLA